MDLGLGSIWRAWFEFKKGKRPNEETHLFQYHLEKNLLELFQDVNSGAYQHGPYKEFVVCDNKRRTISVASIRDRIVHRMLYDYLVKIYDKTFIFDAWSCRLGKGLLACIERVQCFLSKNPHAFIWKADIKKFFDSVDHDILFNILSRKIRDRKILSLLRGIIGSYTLDKNLGGGAWYAYW